MKRSDVLNESAEILLAEGNTALGKTISVHGGMQKLLPRGVWFHTLGMDYGGEGSFAFAISELPGTEKEGNNITVWLSGEGWVWDGPWVGLITKAVTQMIEEQRKQAFRYARQWQAALGDD